MTEVELRQLRYFVAVAEERNFTKAAQRLWMTQPALSRAIRRLETIIGTPLLVRGCRDLTLTTAGLPEGELCQLTSMSPCRGYR